MGELFAEDHTTLIDEIIETPDDEAEVEIPVRTTGDARRRLEKMLEEKRLRDELEDFS